MRILHVASGMHPALGGPPVAILGLAAALIRRGLDVRIMAAARGGERLDPPPGVAIDLHPQGKLAGVWTAHSPSLAHALGRAVPHSDLVHIHELWHHGHFAAYRAARRWSKPFIVTVRNALDPAALRQKRLKKLLYGVLVQRRALQAAAAVHALHTGEADDIQRFVAHRRVVVIPNGVDARRYAVEVERVRRCSRHPALTGSTVLLFMGRLHRGKGLDLLVSAFGCLARSHPGVQLVVAGPDAYGFRMQVEQMVARAGFREQVTFLGMLTGEEKLAVLAGADVFVLPSYFEGFSNAVLEALACGLPVVITDRCNFPEVAAAGAGKVVPVDAGALAAAMHELVAHPRLRAEMAQRAQRLVHDRFDWDVIAGQFIDLYTEFLPSGS